MKNNFFNKLIMLFFGLCFIQENLFSFDLKNKDTENKNSEMNLDMQQKLFFLIIEEFKRNFDETSENKFKGLDKEAFQKMIFSFTEENEKLMFELVEMICEIKELDERFNSFEKEEKELALEIEPYSYYLSGTSLSSVIFDFSVEEEGFLNKINSCLKLLTIGISFRLFKFMYHLKNLRFNKQDLKNIKKNLEDKFIDKIGELRAKIKIKVSEDMKKINKANDFIGMYKDSLNVNKIYDSSITETEDK